MDKPRILMVEDQALVCRVIKPLLETRFTVDAVMTGNAALRSSLEQYHLILLDIDLPDISGIKVCEKIRAMNDNISEIPIVGFTASYTEENKQRSLDAGMNAIYPKGCDMEVLIGVMEKLAASYILRPSS